MGPAAAPRKSPQGKVFADLVTGLAHTCGLGFDGTVQCWGDNGYGQLNVPAGATYAKIASRGHHTCGLTSAGHVDCWGLNVAPFPPGYVPGYPYYPLPSGYPAGQSNAPAGVVFSDVTTGLYNTCGRHKADGTWECWGDGHAAHRGEGGGHRPLDGPPPRQREGRDDRVPA